MPLALLTLMLWQAALSLSSPVASGDEAGGDKGGREWQSSAARL